MGKNINVISCETRPLNQGSRITAWELMEDGIPVTLIADSMSGHVMRNCKVDAVIVGADRIVEDAVFNKIGTYYSCGAREGPWHSVLRSGPTIDIRLYPQGEGRGHRGAQPDELR